MAGFPSPFGGDDDALFDGYDEFIPEHVPDPGPFLTEHDVLTGGDHVAFHQVTRDLFEERTVYDMTFNYNLARLNLDTRHGAAGYRYAEETDAEETDAGESTDAGDGSVLRAEFTPTTPFCPQTRTLTIGSFRAWNGLAERHDYDLVRVRSAPMHHQSRAINERLEALEAEFVETGEVPEGDGLGGGPAAPTDGGSPAAPTDDSIDDDAVPGPNAPF